MKTDPFKMQEEADRLGANIARQRGVAGGGSTPAPTAAPAVAAPVAAAPPSNFATRAGGFMAGKFTRDVNMAITGGEKALNAVGTPMRAGVNVANDFARGVQGKAPAATPVAPKITLPRFQMPVPPARPSPRGGKPMAGTEGSMQSMSRFPAASTASAPADAAAIVPAATGLPAGVTKTVGADGVPTYTGTAGAAPAPGLGTFTGNQGFNPTMRPTTPTFVRAPVPAFDPQAQAGATVTAQRGVAKQVRNDIASNFTPGTAGDEAIRRFRNSQSSFFNRGSPSGRAAEAALYTGQLAALNGTSGAFQQGANQALQEGQEAAAEGAMAAQEQQSRAKMQRQAIRGAMALERTAQDAPQTVAGADGVMRLRRGAVAAPVTDETGQPIQERTQPAAGAITPQDLLKSYTDERSAITGSFGTPEDKAAALAALDANPLYGPITGQNAPSAPPDLATFLTAARASSPGVSDEELTAYYNQNYGAR